jgi:molybdopterin-guanine dinucleotide biosynthesis protein A
VLRVQMSGVVMAGGASKRMGRDKALMPFEGDRLVDRAVRRLQVVADDVVVASGRRRIKDLDVPQIPDQLRDAGPLAGLASGLLQAQHELACVLAVDLPHADPGLFAALGERWEGQAALIPSAGGRAQPLHAVWATSTAIGVSVLVGDGVRSVLRAAEVLGARVLDDTETAELATDDRWAINLNAPEDLPADA